MPDQWEHRVELSAWSGDDRSDPNAEALQLKLNEWGVEGWELVAFEMVRDEHIAPEPDAAALDSSPTAANLA
ncbi:MAG: hypothetical protein GEU81_16045, partial [Nitriliruptorales bacterium]|nr:hypothetical protein [Nitriliruptorales bacterium]